MNMKVLLLLFNILLIQALDIGEDSGFDGIDRGAVIFPFKSMKENGQRNWTHFEGQMKKMFNMNREIMHNLRQMKHMESQKLKQQNRMRHLRNKMNGLKMKNKYCQKKNHEMRGQIQAFHELGGKILNMMRMPKVNPKLN